MPVYLLHYNQPIGKMQTDEQRAIYGLPPRKNGDFSPVSQHYIGAAETIETLKRRIKLHEQGLSGAGIVRAFYNAGIKFAVARIWEDKGFEFEKYLKEVSKSSRRHCPICQGRCVDDFTQK